MHVHVHVCALPSGTGVVAVGAAALGADVVATDLGPVSETSQMTGMTGCRLYDLPYVSHDAS